MINIPFSPTITSLCGPLAINIYGTFIALALLICMKLISLNKKYIQLKLDNIFASLISLSIMMGIIGGRILAIISEPTLYHYWYEWFIIWSGGFSAFGSIIGVVVGAYVFLKKNNIPVLPIFDLMAIYAPLFQSIARLGCLFAGCCYGKSTHCFLHIIYTNKDTIAPYNIALHPTQLYSSLLLFCAFLCMFFIIQYKVKSPGHIFLIYLMFASAERFIIDFFRADRIMFSQSFLSFHQTITLCIFFAALVMLSYKLLYRLFLKNTLPCKQS